MTSEHYHALHSWMDAHPTAKRCVVALDRWLPLIPFVSYPLLLCLLNVRLFRLLGSQRQAALDLTAVIARTVFVPGLTFWGGKMCIRDSLHLIPQLFQILLHLAGRTLAGIRITVDRQIHQHGIAGSQIQSALSLIHIYFTAAGPDGKDAARG